MPAIAEQILPVAARERGARSSVSPVSQVELTFRGRDVPLFDALRTTALRWVAGRAGRPLPDHAWDGGDFELEDVGAQRTAAIGLPDPRYWTARLDDADRVTAQRNWVTEIALAQTGQEVRLGTRLHCVTRGENRPYLASVPRFVREIVRDHAGNAYLEGRLLAPEPWVVDDDVGAADLVALLKKPTRRLDVIVVSLPEESENLTEAVLDVPHLHKMTLGAAHVVAITGPASFDLTDRIGRDFSVYRGAVRTYLPGFDVAEDDRYRHPLVLPNRARTWPGGGIEGFGRLLVANALRRSTATGDQRLPAFHDVRRQVSARRREIARAQAAPDVDLLTLAEEEIAAMKDEMRKQRELDEGLVASAETERDQALEEQKAAEATGHALRARIRALEERLRAIEVDVSPTPIPDTPEEIEQWSAEHLAGAVELHSRALRGIKKSEYEDTSLLYRALLLLRDAYAPMRRDGGLDRKLAFEDGCRELGIELARTFAGTRAGEEGETYFIRHGGSRRLLDLHLTKGRSHEPRYCFRCYFYWDEDTETVVVGWMPSHLDNRMS